MFGFHRRHHHHCCGLSLLSLLLGVFGFKAIKHQNRMSDEDREEVRAKSKLFRAKLREAWKVWEPDEDQEGQQPPPATEG